MGGMHWLPNDFHLLLVVCVVLSFVIIGNNNIILVSVASFSVSSGEMNKILLRRGRYIPPGGARTGSLVCSGGLLTPHHLVGPAVPGCTQLYSLPRLVCRIRADR